MSENIFVRQVKITTVGSAGAAVGSGVLEDIQGFLWDVHLDWHASAPVTSVATIKYTNPSLGNILVPPAGKTDTLYAPLKATVGEDGLATDQYDRYALSGDLQIDVATCNALTDALVATIRYLATSGAILGG